SILRADLAPVASQLLGDHHRIGSPHALAEFGLSDADRHGLVRRDYDPGVDLLDIGLLRPCGAFRIYDLGAPALRHPEADDERAGCSSGVRQKTAAGETRIITIVVAHH